MNKCMHTNVARWQEVRRAGEVNACQAAGRERETDGGMQGEMEGEIQIERDTTHKIGRAHV